MEPAIDVHRVYDFLDGMRVGGQPLVVLKWVTLRYHIHWRSRFRQPLLQFVNHAALAGQIILAGFTQRGVILVREFDHRLFPLMLLFLWPWRRRILLNMNLAAPFPGEHPQWHVQAWRFIANSGTSFLLFEGEALRHEIETVYPGIHLISARFVVQDEAPARHQRPEGSNFVVGFVGSFTKDKGGYETLVIAMRKLLDEPGVKVRMGIRDASRRNSFPEDMNDRVEFVDTWLEDDYARFIAECDAIVTLAARSAYFRRHSAIILDCISLRTLVICPRFPLFASEMCFPAPVGETYEGLEDLPRAVRFVAENADSLRANYPKYFSTRQLSDVQRSLEKGMAHALVGIQASQ